MPEGKENIILLSKLQAPQIKTKTLYRKRLLNLLSKNLNKKIILLCAGAGYGKTTLLSQFISRKKISYVYYHLEKSDAEPVVFFSYLIAGIRKIAPGFGKKFETLSRFFNYPQRYLDIIAGTFINEVIKHIKHDLYIILEDYHASYPSEQIDRVLAYLLKHLPSHLHFFITSRVVPPISMSQLRARDEIFELNSQVLRFTKEEIKNLFGTVYSISLKASELEWIEEHSEGWPTSLRLMLQSSNYLEGIKSSGYVRRILDSYYQSQSNLFNYFAQEIYNKESKEVQRFLMDCSVLEWLTPGLCNAVTGRKNSASILADLFMRNAFLFRIPDMGYRFHKLFRDFLNSKLNDVEKEKRIYRRAGNFYSKENRTEQAVKFYLQAEDYKKAGSIIEKIGFNLIAQGRSSILCSYIEKIPKSIRIQRPLLLMDYAQSLIYAGRSDEAKDNCLRAVKKLKKKARDRKKYADALYELGGINLNQGKFNAAKKWFKMALNVCPKSSSLTRASILNSISSIYTAIGGRNLNEATKYLEKALNIAQHNKFKGLEASILNNWAMNEFKTGNLNGAYLKLVKMVDLLKKYFSPGCGAGFYNAAKISLLLGHKKEARTILNAGIKTCSTYNDLWSMARIWEGYTLVYQELGDFIKAKQLIAKALEIYEKLGIVRLIVSILTEMCKINIKSGELTDAERNLSTVWELKGKRNDPEAIPILLTEAKLRITQGKSANAVDILLNTLKLSQGYKHIFESFLINIELSKVYHIQGKNEKALSALEKAILISHSKGYDYLLLKELQQEKWMLQAIKRENIEKRYIMSLIKKSKLDIHWIDVFLFGVPKVVIDDCEVQDETWKTIKSKKLFFYLLLHWKKKVTQDCLIDALWKNASYKSGSDSLRKAIQYIRQILKSGKKKKLDLITSGKGLYQISPEISVRLDTEEFQNLVKQAKKIKDQGREYEDCLKKAISTYREGFAIGWYDPWVDDLRRFYQRLYEDCLVMMANFYFGKNKFKDAITWYKRLISLDFYNEEYHCKLMKAYSATGKYKEIVKDFEQLKKILKKDLSSEPQEETMRLYKSLCSKKS